MPYEQSSKHYDLIYESKKDYASEAQAIRNIIDKYFASHKPSQAISLLDVACGTGNHLLHFRKWYDCAGVDNNPYLLDIAKDRLGGSDLRLQDMRSIKFEKKFDVVTCLFSAIAHMQNYADLVQALSSMNQSLKPGGVLLIEPGLRKEKITPNFISHDEVKTADGVVHRECKTLVDNNNYILDMEYWVEEPDIEQKPYNEKIILGLFSKNEYISAYEETGHSVTFDEVGITGRGMLIGIKN